MPQGIVKWFDTKKGYGFIRPSDESQADVFVHVRDVQKSGLESLEWGQNVEYQLDVSTSKKYAGKLHIRDIKILRNETAGDS